MAKKPTYEELEKETAERKKAEEAHWRDARKNRVLVMDD